MLRLAVFFIFLTPLFSPCQISIYGIDIIMGTDKKELKTWEPGPTVGIYKKAIGDVDCPFNMVFRQPGNEYLFKTDRGNYDNMPERFRMAYRYLANLFGEASLMETPVGSITDLELKRYPSGTIYFFTHKWDFDAQEYYKDQGDTLTVAQVWSKINSHDEWIKLEWSSLQKYSILLRLHWKRSGLALSVLNYNPERKEGEDARAKKDK